jgi:hypothetical protein
MRSYTLDLIEGPVLGMNMWKAASAQSHGEATTEKHKKESSEPSKKDEEVPDRARLMLWMDRLKVSLCVIKIPMGPEWLYMWTMTEYGRATIARKHLLEVISKHVAERSELISDVHHGTGHLVQDASIMSFPLVRTVIVGSLFVYYCLILSYIVKRLPHRCRKHGRRISIIAMKV